MFIINPGSKVPDDNIVNSYEVACREAEGWLTKMHKDGFPEVELLPYPDESETEDGRWTFRFRHPVTGVEATLETHGVTAAEADRAGLIFGVPRIYWNGSSSGNPKPEDWLPVGPSGYTSDGAFTYKYEYIPTGKEAQQPENTTHNI